MTNRILYSRGGESGGSVAVLHLNNPQVRVKFSPARQKRCDISFSCRKRQFFNEAPVPRFIDNRDGAVTDNLTGLIWLKNSNCLGFASFSDALSRSNNLAHGACGLTDGSNPGDWRLPNIRELQSLQEYSTFAPDLPPGHPFLNVQPTLTWASTSGAGFAAEAWFTIFGVGPTVFEDKAVPYAVWPVRGGNSSRDYDNSDDEEVRREPEEK